MAKKFDMKTIGKIALVLASAGAINWGVLALTKTNLVELLVGAGGLLSTIVYVLVGVAGVITLFQVFKK